jgi:hypothetical protein
MKLFAAVNKSLFRLFTPFHHHNSMELRGLKSYSLFRVIHEKFISQVIDGRIFFGPSLANNISVCDNSRMVL